MLVSLRTISIIIIIIFYNISSGAVFEFEFDLAPIWLIAARNWFLLKILIIKIIKVDFWQLPRWQTIGAAAILETCQSTGSQLACIIKYLIKTIDPSYNQ